MLFTVFERSRHHHSIRTAVGEENPKDLGPETLGQATIPPAAALLLSQYVVK